MNTYLYFHSIQILTKFIILNAIKRNGIQETLFSLKFKAFVLAPSILFLLLLFSILIHL